MFIANSHIRPLKEASIDPWSSSIFTTISKYIQWRRSYGRKGCSRIS